LLRDWSAAEIDRHAVALRYFNPVGADASGQIGEDPQGVPCNLMPFVAQVAVGRRECLQIFGDDYDTTDGTGVRDYIHVDDLARAHVAAVEEMCNLRPFEVINVGRGSGLSVLEIVREFERASGKSVPFQIGPRRSGDAPSVWADAGAAKDKLKFVAHLGAHEMCIDTWRWQSSNPNGFGKI
jgi:UDP-glucose 4-epimerase